MTVVNRFVMHRRTWSGSLQGKHRRKPVTQRRSHPSITGKISTFLHTDEVTRWSVFSIISLCAFAIERMMLRRQITLHTVIQKACRSILRYSVITLTDIWSPRLLNFSAAGLGGKFATERLFSSTLYDTIRYDTIEEFNVDWKAEYSALSSTRSETKTTNASAPLIQYRLRSVKSVRKE